MQMAAKQLVDVKTFAIEIRVERHALFARRLEKGVDEKRTTGELLDQQISRCLTRDDVLSLGHLLHELCGFDRVELLETQ